MNTKDKLISETLESFQGAKKAELPLGFNEKLMNRVLKGEAKIISIRPQITWTIAAGIALLICINSLILDKYNKSLKNENSNAYAMYSEYFSYTEQF